MCACPPPPNVAKLHHDWQIAKQHSDEFLIVTLVYTGHHTDLFVAFEDDCTVVREASGQTFSYAAPTESRPLIWITVTAAELPHITRLLDRFAWPWQVVNAPDHLQHVMGIPDEVYA